MRILILSLESDLFIAALANSATAENLSGAHTPRAQSAKDNAPSRLRAPFWLDVHDVLANDERPVAL